MGWGERRTSKEAVTTVLVSTDEVLGMEMERKDDRDAGRNRMLCSLRTIREHIGIAQVWLQ